MYNTYWHFDFIFLLWMASTRGVACYREFYNLIEQMNTLFRCSRAERKKKSNFTPELGQWTRSQTIFHSKHDFLLEFYAMFSNCFYTCIIAGRQKWQKSIPIIRFGPCSLLTHSELRYRRLNWKVHLKMKTNLRQTLVCFGICFVPLSTMTKRNVNASSHMSLMYMGLNLPPSILYSCPLCISLKVSHAPICVRNSKFDICAHFIIRLTIVLFVWCAHVRVCGWWVGRSIGW